MSTRSRIAVATPAGFRSIYCHWDGNPLHNGRILYTHYRDEENHEKVLRLMKEGDLSILGEEIGEKHDFDDPEARKGQCTFYRRDRKEKHVDSATHEEFPDLIQYARDSDAEFLYLNIDGFWLFAPMDKLSANPSMDTLMVLQPETWFDEIVQWTAHRINRRYGKGFVEEVKWNADRTGGYLTRGFAENVTDQSPFKLTCKDGRKYLTFLGRTRRIFQN